MPPAATTETALVGAEIDRRQGVWRLRAIGQGYDDGLAGLARDFVSMWSSHKTFSPTGHRGRERRVSAAS